MNCLFHLLLPVILFQSCSGQNQNKKEVYLEDVKWSITIPENFETVSAEDWAVMQNKGAKAIENTFGEEVVNQAKVIFVFKSGQLNYFEANEQPFDEDVDGDHLESFQTVIEVLYETFISQLPGIEIDTTRTVTKISNVAFHTCEMKVTYPNKMIMHFIMYSTLFKKKEFTVNIMYLDEKKGRLMKEAFFNSKFGK